MDEITAAKQRRARRRTMKQQRDHRRTGTQFTRTVQPYVRNRVMSDDDIAYARWLRDSQFEDVTHLLTKED